MMTSPFSRIFLVIVWALVLNTPAEAESNRRRGIKAGLSQLVFDTRGASKEEPPKDPESMMNALSEGSEHKIQNAQPPHQRAALKPAASKETAKAPSNPSLSTELASPPAKVAPSKTSSATVDQQGQSKSKKEDAQPLIREMPLQASGANFVMPRFKGVFYDASSPHLVTSKVSWKKDPNTGCGGVSQTEELKHKSASLKEVFFRFSGSDTFYDLLNGAQCSRSCGNSDREPYIVGLGIGEINGGTFQFIEKDDGCRYQLQKSPDAAWGKVSATKVLCSCL